MSLLDKQPRSASVMTLTDTRLAQIRSANFERLLLQQPKISLKLLKETVNRLRRTSQILARISTMDVPHRLYYTSKMVIALASLMAMKSQPCNFQHIK